MSGVFVVGKNFTTPLTWTPEPWLTSTTDVGTGGGTGGGGSGDSSSWRYIDAGAPSTAVATDGRSLSLAHNCSTIVHFCKPHLSFFKASLLPLK
jgi:hypothetical protein